MTPRPEGYSGPMPNEAYIVGSESNTPLPDGVGEYPHVEWAEDQQGILETLADTDFRDCPDAVTLLCMARSVPLIPYGEGEYHALSYEGVKDLVDAALYDEEHRLAAFEQIPEIANLQEAVLLLPEADELREEIGLTPESEGKIVEFAKKPQKILATWANRRAA